MHAQFPSNLSGQKRPRHNVPITLAIFVVGMAIVGFGLWVAFRETSPPQVLLHTPFQATSSKIPKENAGPVEGKNPQRGDATIDNSLDKSPGKALDPDAPLPFDAPSVVEYYEEVRRSPHSTPASLVRFGSEFARRLALAKGDPALEQGLFDELTHCTVDAQGTLPRSVRSFCYLRLRTLAEADSTRFESQFQRVIARIPDAPALTAAQRGFP